MKKVLLTGASSGIGLAIARMLVEEGGYDVYGIGRNFSFRPDSPHFRAVALDLLDENALEKVIRDIRKDGPVDIFISNAGCAWYGLHEEMNPQKIHEMVRVNLEVPLVISQILLRDIKKAGGSMIFISSVTAQVPAPHGAAYGATKAGILSFGRSLFEEARKSGVRVTTILPDMTATGLYRNADFTASGEAGCALDPADVADAVRYCLKRPDGVVVPEIVLRPQYHRIERKKR
ncbi:MAG: SDR family oxidoreductase [Lachnospiraceae bacterium]|nr:SDR family oxidoreductase [Lachnospiraceae bacterium]